MSVHNEAELRAEYEELQQELAAWPAKSIDDARRQRDRLRPFGRAASVLTRVFEQEQDLGREKLRVDKKRQRIRQISEQISSNTVDIDTLERRLVDLKATKQRLSPVLAGLEDKRQALKSEVNRIGSQIANQPEVNETERRLQRSVNEALEIVTKSFGRFRESMRDRIATATSDLFLRLTTEKDYSGVSISEDYLLSVVDDQGRALSMISAGANQILTMAFIGALAECSVDEAPMVMDTPFGRLDTGHRNAILSWVSTFSTQVILFVQSGEYEPQRHAHLLNGKIGRIHDRPALTNKVGGACCMTVNDSGLEPGAEHDKVTIGPSAANKDILDLLVSQGHFNSSLAAFQAAAMLAIRKNLEMNSAPASAGTMWNRGSVNRQILDFLTWYVPTTAPARVLEQLGNAGTAYIGEKVKTGGYRLTEIFDLPRMGIE